MLGSVLGNCFFYMELHNNRHTLLAESWELEYKLLEVHLQWRILNICYNYYNNTLIGYKLCSKYSGTNDWSRFQHPVYPNALVEFNEQTIVWNTFYGRCINWCSIKLIFLWIYRIRKKCICWISTLWNLQLSFSIFVAQKIK